MHAVADWAPRCPRTLHNVASENSRGEKRLVPDRWGDSATGVESVHWWAPVFVEYAPTDSLQQSVTLISVLPLMATRIAHGLNQRFQQGTPSGSVGRAGVVVRAFDKFTRGPALHWLAGSSPCSLSRPLTLAHSLTRPSSLSRAPPRPHPRPRPRPHSHPRSLHMHTTHIHIHILPGDHSAYDVASWSASLVSARWTFV